MDEAPPRERLPGCGLAAYVTVLGLIFSVGVVGVVVSWGSLFAGSSATAPTRLSYGGVVDPAVLRPMRDAGLVAEGEVPDAFHAEVLTGHYACAISGGEVLRLSQDGGQSISLAEIESVTTDGRDVVVVGPGDTIRCPFGEGEGGDSFARMLQAR